MAYTSVDQLGMDQRKVVENKEQYLEEARARGLSDSRIQGFLQENPFDYHRLKDLELDGAPTAGSAGGTSAGTGGTAPLGDLAALDTELATPAVSGLMSAGGGTDSSGLGEGAAAGVIQAAPGSRAGLGNRIPPSLAALLQVRAY